KRTFLNNIFGFGALLIVFINILIILLLMFQEEELHLELIPLWLLALGLPMILIGLIIIISTVLLFIYRLIFKSSDKSALEKKVEKKLDKKIKLRRDLYRKIPHALIFIGLFVVWYVSLDLVVILKEESDGMIPPENNMLFLYLQLLTEPNSIQEVLFSLGWFYYVLFFFCYGLCLIIIANEFARKTKHVAFPLLIFTRILTEEEKRGYGTYLYFAIGQMFAALLCPPMVYFAVLGISSIADLMTSQIGIKFGQKHIKWNDDKTWEGALAGIITCFSITYFFMGFIWALIFMVAFLAFDILTNKPINLSDNLLIPIGCSLIYVLVRYFLDLNYDIILLELIK
ncbi:MAG: hypothetical protein ACTSUT_02230, partial [Promethearchaeota archaeon]